MQEWKLGWLVLVPIQHSYAYFKWTIGGLIKCKKFITKVGSPMGMDPMWWFLPSRLWYWCKSNPLYVFVDKYFQAQNGNWKATLFIIHKTMLGPKWDEGPFMFRCQNHLIWEPRETKPIELTTSKIFHQIVDESTGRGGLRKVLGFFLKNFVKW